MENILCSVFFIIGVSSFANFGSGYKLEISQSEPKSKPITPENLVDKLDLSSFRNTLEEKLVPTLLERHESGSTPGKETTHLLGRSLTESLTKALSDAFNSKLGQEFMIAAGIKKRPSLMDNLYETIQIYIKWIGTAASNKLDEIGHKGLMRTFSDTIFDTFGSHGHIATTSPHGNYKPDISNGKILQHETQAVMQTRGIGLMDGLNESHRSRSYNQRPGPWNRLLYDRYDDRRNPYSTMGGERGFFSLIGYLISSLLSPIFEFFSRFLGYPPPPPPGGRPTIIRRPLQSHYN